MMAVLASSSHRRHAAGCAWPFWPGWGMRIVVLLLAPGISERGRSNGRLAGAPAPAIPSAEAAVFRCRVLGGLWRDGKGGAAAACLPGGEQDEKGLDAEGGEAERAAPVADVAVIAEEAADGAGQHVAAHGGGRQTAGGGPHQPARPGDHHPADRDRGCDYP